MGNIQQSEIYSIAVSDPLPGETPIFRHPDASHKLHSTPDQRYKTYQDVLLDLFSSQPHSPYLGSRRIINGRLQPDFSFLTFEEVEQKAKDLGSGIIKLNFTQEKSQFKDYKLRFIGIYGKNSVEWTLVDIANNLYGFTTVPFYDTLGEAALIHMFKETETSTVFTTCSHIPDLVEKMKDEKLPFLRNLVVMDEWNITDQIKYKLSEVKWFKFQQVIKAGQKDTQPYTSVTPQDITTFSYTSGTTGKPKGAMLTHSNMLASLAAVSSIYDFKKLEPVHLSYLSMAHVFEKVTSGYITYMGGRIGFFSGDVKRLGEDLQTLQPTLLISVPRLLNRFYDKLKSGFEDLGGCRAILAKKGLEAKFRNHDLTGATTHWFYDRIIFNRLRGAIGGKVKYILTGSAPLSEKVKRFLKVAFCCKFLEGYGQTEAFASNLLCHSIERRLDIVGGPLPQIEMKIVDAKEIGYTVKDKPNPRGELLLRGGSIMAGYYKNEEKTKETIDEQGWLKTGDICELIPDINAIKILDRRNNMFKLSQGEYIAPDKLQEIYKTVRGVLDIFVYGESLKSCLVAMVNYEPQEIEEVARELGIQGSFESLCENGRVYSYVLEEMEKVRIVHRLKGFERVRRFEVDPVSFVDRGLVTSTFKLIRHDAKAFYIEKLRRLYKGLD